MKQRPSKSQKKRFTKGFWWGKLEHRLETYTTFLLLIGVMLQVAGLVTRKWLWVLVASGFFGVALVFRGAGIAHKVERHYMRYLRFGAWKREKK